jgi:hypothetical protein
MTISKCSLKQCKYRDKDMCDKKINEEIYGIGNCLVLLYEKYPECENCEDDKDMCGELEDCPDIDLDNFY